MKMRPHFRFEDLEIWQPARALAEKLHLIADDLERRRLYRYAEQLRAAGLSITNNLAEGSGSSHDREFRQYCNIARRSLFEDASMLMVFESLGLLRTEQISEVLTDCDLLSRKITSFSRSSALSRSSPLALSRSPFALRPSPFALSS